MILLKSQGLTEMWVRCSTGDVYVGFIIGYVDLCEGHTAKEKVSWVFLKSQGLTVGGLSALGTITRAGKNILISM